MSDEKIYILYYKFIYSFYLSNCWFEIDILVYPFCIGVWNIDSFFHFTFSSISTWEISVFIMKTNKHREMLMVFLTISQTWAFHTFVAECLLNCHWAVDKLSEWVCCWGKWWTLCLCLFYFIKMSISTLF